MCVCVCVFVCGSSVHYTNDRHKVIVFFFLLFQKSVTCYTVEQQVCVSCVCVCVCVCYTECMGVPQYLCHRSMALVTMASVFS